MFRGINCCVTRRIDNNEIERTYRRRVSDETGVSVITVVFDMIDLGSYYCDDVERAGRGYIS